MEVPSYSLSLSYRLSDVQEGNELLLRDSQIEDLNDFFFHHLIIQNMMCKAMAAINFHMTCKKMDYVMQFQDPNVNIGHGSLSTVLHYKCSIFMRYH